MMPSPVFAVSFGELLGNAWQWGQANPLASLSILLGVVLLICVVAGGAGFFPVAVSALFTLKGLLQLALYVGLGLALGSGGIVLLANFGAGPTRPNGPPVPRVPPSVRLVKITRSGPDGLDVKVHYHGGAGPDTRTWNRYNLETEVTRICDKVPSENRVLTVEWVEVPYRLRETIVESFRANGVSVREEVVTP